MLYLTAPEVLPNRNFVFREGIHLKLFIFESYLEAFLAILHLPVQKVSESNPEHAIITDIFRL